MSGSDHVAYQEIRSKITELFDAYPYYYDSDKENIYYDICTWVLNTCIHAFMCIYQAE